MLTAAHHKRVRKPKLKPQASTHPRFDSVMLIGAMISPLMSIPQIWQIYSTKEVSGISLITSASYLFGAIAWTIYGIVHKDKVIAITNGAWIILDAAIVAGVIIYGMQH